jgi:2-dehydro-3-deoxygluconokinase
MKSGSSLDVMCVGEPMVEFSEQGSGSERLGYGGDVMNVAVAVSRLGGRSGIASRIGDDHLGEGLIEFLAREAICLKNTTVEKNGKTGSYSIHQTEQGHTFSYQRDQSSASKWGSTEAEALDLNSAAIVHFSGITQAISESCARGCDVMLARACEAKSTVSYDPNYRPQLWSLEAARAGLDRVLAFGPILLPGLDDARLLTRLADPEDIVRYFIERGASLVALTAGADGVYLGDGSGVTRVPGLKSACVDASGAGDCFDGGFLVRLAKGDTPIQAAEFANKAAAMSVTKQGAAVSIPTLGDLNEQTYVSAITGA